MAKQKECKKLRRGQSPSDVAQAARSRANKARRQAKAARRKEQEARKAFDANKGISRTQRRSKARWAKGMLTAKAKKAESRKLAEAAMRGGRIIALPTPESMAMVAAWQRARDAMAAKATANRKARGA